ncbi:hypothetical protein [Tateyamaria omphalii]|uniref:SRPBCC family protein n=1 Tax=Tateyamaria omphalii TaxID=299262 RepID=A0A1P8MQP1_9RHOB|nr:hypothetical protein [Tateyamaria omphalii]APX10378.1 hypothetical protein BWR18_00690 [Tateyamaria omphalii]
MHDIELSTFLDAPPDRVWDALHTPRLLSFVAHPILRFDPVEPAQLPERWVDGDYIVRMTWRGVVPLGRQVIRISHPEGAEGVRYIRDNGSSAIIRRWDHLVSVAPEGAGTRYTDRVTIEAGVLTWAVARFARSFYAHRQRRWRQLVAHGFDYAAV